MRLLRDPTLCERSPDWPNWLWSLTSKRLRREIRRNDEISCVSLRRPDESGRACERAGKRQAGQMAPARRPRSASSCSKLALEGPGEGARKSLIGERRLAQRARAIKRRGGAARKRAGMSRFAGPGNSCQDFGAPHRTSQAKMSWQLNRKFEASRGMVAGAAWQWAWRVLVREGGRKELDLSCGRRTGAAEAQLKGEPTVGH